MVLHHSSASSNKQIMYCKSHNGVKMITAIFLSPKDQQTLYFYISIDSLFNMMSPIEVAYQFRQKIFKPSAVKIQNSRVTTTVHNKQNNCLWDLNNFTGDNKIRWVGRSEKYRIFQICLLQKHTIGISKMVLTLCESNAKSHQETGNFA